MGTQGDAMMHRAYIILALALSGCWGSQDNPFGTLEAEYVSSPDASSSPVVVDNDKDGIPADKDCNDSDSKVGAALTWYRDSDNDGFGDSASTFVACTQPQGYVGNAADCDDKDAKVFPKAVELCDGKDNDCNGKTDDVVNAKWFIDADGDGKGDPTAPVESGCSAPNPKLVANSDDCNDLDPLTYKGAPEICDGKDNNCNGTIDEGVKITLYVDSDADGHGDAKKKSAACAPLPGLVTAGDDCDDGNANVYPGAKETCNGVDDNCDGKTDEGVMTTFYADLDNDGYGDAKSVMFACNTPTTQPLHHVANSDDCNDKNAQVNPKAVESCNGIDDNCNGVIDEDVKFVWWPDTDADGWGDGNSKVAFACTQPQGYASKPYDCNDKDSKVSPVGVEACNGQDDNCDGKIDEASVASMCDDKNPLTIDVCAADKGCSHTSIEVVLTCKLPAGISDGVCSVGTFYSLVEDFGPLSVAKGKMILKATEMCAKLATGEVLHVNNLVATELGSTWTGGIDVKVTVDSKEVKGTPGDVTILVPGLDINYVLADFKICQ